MIFDNGYSYCCVFEKCMHVKELAIIAREIVSMCVKWFLNFILRAFSEIEGDVLHSQLRLWMEIKDIAVSAMVPNIFSLSHVGPFETQTFMKIYNFVQILKTWNCKVYINQELLLAG